MKYVHKNEPPGPYMKWRMTVRGTLDEDYRRLRNPLKHTVLQSLLQEQGHICAYTMKRIYDHNAHIEHIKPETLCRSDVPGSDLDYVNMIACFPEEGMAGAYRYGAQLKGDWWDDGGRHFVSPLNAVCENRFRFGINGKISAVKNDPDAKITIDVLALDHDTLCEDRENAIKEFIWGSDGKTPLSPAQAQSSVTGVNMRNGGGEYYEYCVAISQALREYVQFLEKRAKKRKYARRKH